MLGATVHHLDHWDSQYRSPCYGYTGPQRTELVPAIAASLTELAGSLGIDTWVIPLGLSHDDHRNTAAGCALVIAVFPQITWLAYEDLPYAAEKPSEVQVAAQRLRDRHLVVSPAEVYNPDVEMKRAVVSCYASQLPPLRYKRIEDAVKTPERIHSVTCA